jgi:hypothetical protein
LCGRKNLITTENPSDIPYYSTQLPDVIEIIETLQVNGLLPCCQNESKSTCESYNVSAFEHCTCLMHQFIKIALKLLMHVDEFTSFDSSSFFSTIFHSPRAMLSATFWMDSSLFDIQDLGL